MKIIGHGVDIVAVDKMRRLLNKQSKHFVARVFTDPEKVEIQKSAKPEEKIAGKFASKEAVLKALGTGLTQGIAWTDIEILSNTSGKPEVSLSGKAAELAVAAGINSWFISISHTDGIALGSVIAVASK